MFGRFRRTTQRDPHDELCRQAPLDVQSTVPQEEAEGHRPELDQHLAIQEQRHTQRPDEALRRVEEQRGS